MHKRLLLAALLSSALTTTPVIAVANDLAGGIIGGVIGGIIVNEMNKNKSAPQRTAQPRTSSASVPSAQRVANREMQTALNYYGYNVGTPDGSVGPKTRAGVAQYQSLLGYPATGQITEFERTILVTAYQRALAGDAMLMRVAATHPQGLRGTLLQQRDDLTAGTSTQMAGSYGGLPREVSESLLEISRNSNVEPAQLLQRSGFIQLADMNGDGRTDYILDTSVTGSAFWCNATACTVRVFASTPSGFQRNDFQAFNVTPATFVCQQGSCAKSGIEAQPPVMAATPAPALPGGTVMAAAPVPTAQTVVQAPVMVPVAAAVAPAASALPLFAPQTDQTASLAAHCSKVAILTTANGYTTAASMTDPAAVLSEQFCLARTYAMADGDDIVSRLSGTSPAMVAEQCRAMAPTMKEHLTAVSLQPRDTVLQGVSGFMLTSGASPEQLATTARICLGSGYATDDVGVAVASALLLTVLGEKGYAELVGHHLAQGFGATRRVDLALDWYETALGDVGEDTSIALVSDVPDRAALIRKAAWTMAGKAEPASAVTVPVFSVVQPKN